MSIATAEIAPSLPATVEVVPGVEPIEPSANFLETICGSSLDMAGMIPDATGVSATIKLGNEGPSDLTIIDIASLYVIEDDGTSVIVSILGEEQIIDKRVKYLVVGVAAKLDDKGDQKLTQLEVREGDTHIGRVASPDFLLEDNVSRDHATLRVDADGKLEYIDHSTNGSTIEFEQTTEAAAELKLKKDGAAVLAAAGIMPPVPPAKETSEYADKYLRTKRYQARELQDARATQRAEAKKDIKSGLVDSKNALSDAKHDRATARLKYNKLTKMMDAAELKGKYQREVEHEITHGNLQNASARTKRAHMKGARDRAKSEANSNIDTARAKVRYDVSNARADIGSFKAKRRDMGYFSAKGSRNTYFENRRIVSGGFTLGEVVGAGMTDEQKKQLEDQMRTRLSTKKVSPHMARGRISTRRAVASSRI